MPDSSWSVLINPVFSTFLGISVATLTNRMSFKRTKQEKIWELKRKNYTDILLNLSEIKDGCASITSAYSGRFYSDFQSEWVDEKNAEISQRMVATRQAFFQGILTTSEDFKKTFDAMMTDLKAIDGEGDETDNHNQYEKIIIRYRDLLTTIGHREIASEKSWFPTFQKHVREGF